MLPLPIFLLLIFSATMLAPSPHVIIGLIRIAALQPSVWNTLPVSIPSSVSRPPPEAITELPVLVPQVPLDASPTSESRVPSPMHLAINNTIAPYSFEHTMDDRPTSAAVVLVVLFAMFNCLAYKLLVHVNNGSNTEGKSKQLVVFPASGLAPSTFQEFIYPHTQVVGEMSSLLLPVDADNSVSESLEHERLRPAVTPPSLSSFEVTILSQPSTPFGQSTPLLRVLSCDLSLDNSEKTTDSDSKPTMLSPLDSGYPSVSENLATVFEAPTSTPVVASVEIDDPTPELPRIPLDTETAKEDTPTPLDPTNATPSRVLEPGSELHDKPFFPPAMEDVSNLDADADRVFRYESPALESDDEETFDYKGVDWTPETPGVPLTPPTGAQAPLPDPYPLPGSYYDHFSDLAPSLSVTSVQDVMEPPDHSPRISLPPDVTSKPAATACAARYALDDIRVGLKDRREAEITSITRCTSADNLGGTFGAIKATNALAISDSHAVMSEFRRDTFDDETVHNQTMLLRADAPIFIPRGSGKVEDLGLKTGLTASIAPKNEMLQTEGYVVASELMHMRTIGQERAPVTTPKPAPDSLEPSIENSEAQASIDAVGVSNSCRYLQTERSISPGFSSGLHASIHAPHRRSTGVGQTLGDNTEELATPPAPTTTRSSPTNNGSQRGLAGSIHAPGAHTPDQAIQHSPKHSADAPNWAAAARAQVSSTASEGGVPAERDTSSNPLPDTDVSELPTTARCAAKDQEEESSVDNSDGSSDHADVREGTAGSGETDNGLDEADGPNEAQIRRTRRRGKPRRPRQKAPYIPPPRMQVLTQHLAVDALGAQVHATNALAQPPAPLIRQHFTPIPLPPHHSASAPGHMVSRNVIPNHLGQHPHYRHPWLLGSVHMATHYPSPFPGFQPTGPHNPIYHHMPHPQNLSLQAPFPSLYGR